jgi:hypothetical protein
MRVEPACDSGKKSAGDKGGDFITRRVDAHGPGGDFIVMHRNESAPIG